MHRIDNGKVGKPIDEFNGEKKEHSYTHTHTSKEKILDEFELIDLMESMGKRKDRFFLLFILFIIILSKRSGSKNSLVVFKIKIKFIEEQIESFDKNA